MNRNCSDVSQIPYIKPLTHLSIKNLVISPDYVHEYIWVHIYSYVFRELADISAVLVRAFHPHGGRTVLPLAGLEKFKKVKLMSTMKAKFLVHFPQKVYLFLHTLKWFCCTDTHFPNPTLKRNSKSMSLKISSNTSWISDLCSHSDITLHWQWLCPRGWMTKS